MASDTLPTLHNFDHLVSYINHKPGLSQEDEYYCLWSLTQIDGRYQDRPERQAFVNGDLTCSQYYTQMIAEFRKETGM